MNEQVLTALFDFQRIAGNPRLARLIAETEGRCGGTPLSEDELDKVWAAGTFPPPTTKFGRNNDD